MQFFFQTNLYFNRRHLHSTYIPEKRQIWNWLMLVHLYMCLLEILAFVANSWFDHFLVDLVLCSVIELGCIQFHVIVIFYNNVTIKIIYFDKLTRNKEVLLMWSKKPNNIVFLQIVLEILKCLSLCWVVFLL